MTYDEFVMRTVVNSIGAFYELYRENRALARRRCIEEAKVLADEMFQNKTVDMNVTGVDNGPSPTRGRRKLLRG